MKTDSFFSSAFALSLAFFAQSSADTTAALTTFAEISGTRPGYITVTPGNCVIITQAFG